MSDRGPLLNTKEGSEEAKKVLAVTLRKEKEWQRSLERFQEFIRDDQRKHIEEVADTLEPTDRELLLSCIDSDSKKAEQGETAEDDHKDSFEMVPSNPTAVMEQKKEGGGAPAALRRVVDVGVPGELERAMRAGTAPGTVGKLGRVEIRKAEKVVEMLELPGDLDRMKEIVGESKTAQDDHIESFEVVPSNPRLLMEQMKSNWEKNGDRVREHLMANMKVKDICKAVGCNPQFVYQVRRKMITELLDGNIEVEVISKMVGCPTDMVMRLKRDKEPLREVKKEQNGNSGETTNKRQLRKRAPKSYAESSIVDIDIAEDSGSDYNPAGDLEAEESGPPNKRKRQSRSLLRKSNTGSAEPVRKRNTSAKLPTTKIVVDDIDEGEDVQEINAKEMGKEEPKINSPIEELHKPVNRGRSLQQTRPTRPVHKRNTVSAKLPNTKMEVDDSDEGDDIQETNAKEIGKKGLTRPRRGRPNTEQLHKPVNWSKSLMSTPIKGSTESMRKQNTASAKLANKKKEVDNSDEGDDVQEAKKKENSKEDLTRSLHQRPKNRSIEIQHKPVSHSSNIQNTNKEHVGDANGDQTNKRQLRKRAPKNYADTTDLDDVTYGPARASSSTTKSRRPSRSNSAQRKPIIRSSELARKPIIKSSELQDAKKYLDDSGLGGESDPLNIAESSGNPATQSPEETQSIKQVESIDLGDDDQPDQSGEMRPGANHHEESATVDDAMTRRVWNLLMAKKKVQNISRSVGCTTLFVVEVRKKKILQLLNAKVDDQEICNLLNCPMQLVKNLKAISEESAKSMEKKAVEYCPKEPSSEHRNDSAATNDGEGTVASDGTEDGKPHPAESLWDQNRERVRELLMAKKTVNEICTAAGCNKGFVYQVRRNMISELLDGKINVKVIDQILGCGEDAVERVKKSKEKLEKKDEGGENEYWTAEDVWREIRVGGGGREK